MPITEQEVKTVWREIRCPTHKDPLKQLEPHERGTPRVYQCPYCDHVEEHSMRFPHIAYVWTDDTGKHLVTEPDEHGDRARVDSVDVTVQTKHVKIKPTNLGGKRREGDAP